MIIKSADAVAVSYCYRNFAVPNIIESDVALPLLPFYTKLKTED